MVVSGFGGNGAGCWAAITAGAARVSVRRRRRVLIGFSGMVVAVDALLSPRGTRRGGPGVGCSLRPRREWRAAAAAAAGQAVHRCRKVTVSRPGPSECPGTTPRADAGRLSPPGPPDRPG